MNHPIGRLHSSQHRPGLRNLPFTHEDVLQLCDKRVTNLFKHTHTSAMAKSQEDEKMTEDYFWGLTLDKSKKEETWDPDLKSDGNDSSHIFRGEHTLLVKQVVLGPEAADGEVNVVEVEAMGYKTDIKFPIVVLKGGSENSQCCLDLLFPDPPVTIRLIKGNGPIHLLGNHSVGIHYLNVANDEVLPEDDDDDEIEEEFEEEEEEEDEDAIEEEKKSVEEKKRKIAANSNSKGGGKAAKRPKVDNESN